MKRRLDLTRLIGISGTGLFIACLYLSPAEWLPETAIFRPAMLSAVLMLAGMVLQRVRYGDRIEMAGGIGASMCVLFGFAALSFLWAFDPEETKAFTADAVKEVFAFVGFVSVLHDVHDIRRAMRIAAICSIVPAWGTIQRYQAGIGLVEGFRGNWLGLLANPNQLAMVMAVTLPWALYLRTRSRGLMRWLLLLAMGLEIGCIVATHSRGGALGLGVAMLSYALLAQHKLRALSMVALAAAALVIFAPTTFWARTETIQDYAVDASAQGRIKSWETGLKAVAESPLLGVGANNYPLAWNRFAPRNTREHAYAAHNMWMQVLVELGLIGVTAFASMFLLILRGLWKARRSPEYSGEARTLLASFAALLICGTTGGYAFNWFFYMVLGVAGAVIVRAKQHAAQAAKEIADDGDLVLA